MRTADGIYDFVANSLATVAHDAGLFIGVALTLVGLFSIEADKFCDGNTADYLSCTRPSTYYFYSPLDITLIIAGVFLVLIWIRRGRDR